MTTYTTNLTAFNIQIKINSNVINTNTMIQHPKLKSKQFTTQ
jgi:hypothetical protein